MVDETKVVILADEQGSYYVLPAETVVAARATPEQVAAIEALLQSNADVRGYFTSFDYVQALVASNTAEAASGDAKQPAKLTFAPDPSLRFRLL